MNGYMGKALLVDLSTGSIGTRDIPQSWYDDFLGGEGLAVRLFHDYLDPSRDPYDPETPVIFATGPLNGTTAPEGGRLVVVFRSPATTTLGLTNVGGHFAPALKKAGYDLLLVKGKAPEPVWLSIQDDQVRIEDASNIWGKRITPTEDYIKEKMGSGAQVISIGPAGENLVRFSSLMTQKHRAAGRGGGGAMFGSKNLKAIGVVGTKAVPVADPQGPEIGLGKGQGTDPGRSVHRGPAEALRDPRFLQLHQRHGDPADQKLAADHLSRIP